MLDVTAVERWLALAIVEIGPAVSEAHLFGSVIPNPDEASDVDVLIIFDRWEVRNECASLRRAFREAFGMPLHIQMFHGSQRREIECFLHETGETRRLL